MNQQTVTVTASSETESLGQYLQRQRTEKGVDLFQAAEETRIPQPTIQAMENGDYASLPADAFARGFYAIYARFLELDTREVLERYTRERGIALKNQKHTVQAPSVLGNSVSPMAERPLVTPLSMLACGLVILILLTVGFSWFFSWNPANFLSDKLRSFGNQPVIEHKTDGDTSSTTPAAPAGHQEAGQNAAGTSAIKYTLMAEFPDLTKTTVTVDDEFPEEMTFSAGQTHSWHAKNALTMVLPSQTRTRLTLNGVSTPLPAPIDGFITVLIPGSPAQ